MPDMIFYNILISAHEKGKHLERALKVSNNMQRQSVLPNLVTLGVVISSCSKGVWVMRAMNAFLRLQ